jgi:hypothetical protein
MSPEWEPVERGDESRLRFFVQNYQHKVTGEVINSDPRLLPEALGVRGVKVQTFTIT